jgi:hypothetical protein
MTLHADPIWKIAESMRGRGERLDVANLVRQSKEAGVPIGVQELLFIMRRLGPRDVDHFVPTDVAEFVAKFLEPASPKTILDPWAGAGLLTISLNQHLRPGKYEALSANTAACEVFQMLEGSAGIEIQCGDPLRALAQSSDWYDAVVGNTPFGMLSREPLVVKVGAEDRKINDDYGNLLILQSCLRLTENGLGVFIVPTSFFIASGRKGKARRALEELGFRVTAAIELPAGTFHPFTSLTTNVVVLRKSSDTNLFTAKYVPDSKHQRELLKNLADRSEGKSPSLGRLVPADTFRGFSAVEFAERGREQSRRMGLLPYPFGEVVLELNTPPSSRHFDSFPEKPNAVYLPQMASTNATTSQESLPERLKSYFQIVLNPKVADAEFVAGLLNTHFGQLWRDSLRTGETIPRIGKKLLEESTFYLPPASSREIQHRVVNCHRVINGLKNELNEIEATLWTRPAGIDKVQAALQMVNREDRFEDWIDTLPFPLASILWVCHTQAGSYREQYERKIHFFEALSEFLAVLHLSAFASNPALWPSKKDRLRDVLAKQSLSLERATFGTWKTVVEVLTSETRRLLNDEEEMCFELFRTRNRQLIESIASKRLVSVIQRANALRNDWMGHTGAVRDADARAVNEELVQYIGMVREVFGVCWQNYELLLPAECKVRAGVYFYKARKVMGSRTPFPSETVELVEAMEDGHLHLRSRDEQRALKLLPLVKVMPSPKTEQNACYFYNRQQADGIRFLSYHFESDSEVVQLFPDVSEALRKLTQA